jgi:hypothetical protein
VPSFRNQSNPLPVGDRGESLMEWLAVIPILIIVALALGSSHEKIRDLRVKARYARWDSSSRRRGPGKRG